MQSKIRESLLTETEAALALGLQRQTLAVRRCKGNPLLPFIRIGRNIRYRPEDISTLVEDKCVGGAE